MQKRAKKGSFCEENHARCSEGNFTLKSEEKAISLAINVVTGWAAPRNSCNIKVTKKPYVSRAGI
jgi:hypothetical protein